MRLPKVMDPEIYAVASMFPDVNFADAPGTRALFATMLQAAEATAERASEPGIFADDKGKPGHAAQGEWRAVHRGRV